MAVPSCSGRLLLELRLYEYMEPSEVTLPLGVRQAGKANGSATRLPRGVRLDPLSGTKLLRGLRPEAADSGTRLHREAARPPSADDINGAADPADGMLTPLRVPVKSAGTRLLRGLRFGLRSAMRLLRELRNAVTSATMLGRDDRLYSSGSGSRLLRDPLLKTLGSMLPREPRLYASSGTRLLRGLRDEGASDSSPLRLLRPIVSAPPEACKLRRL